MTKCHFNDPEPLIMSHHMQKHCHLLLYCAINTIP
jgi:hypothetical protein